MTKRKTRSGWYVTAIHGTKTAWLVGPFDNARAASMMVSAASHAANRTADPRFAFAAFGVSKLTVPIDDKLPVGRVDLTDAASDDVYRALVITGGYSLKITH